MASGDSTNEYLFFTDQETARDDGFPEGAQKIIVPTQVQPTEAASPSAAGGIRRSERALVVA